MWGLLLTLLLLLAFAKPAYAAPTISGCPVFPSNNVWNYDISSLPIHSNSANFINSIGPSGTLHPDFGAGLWDGGPIGIPYIVVPQNQTTSPITFDYADESDGGPYPIPANPPIEGGPNATGDRHILMIQQGSCKLYELYSSYPQTGGTWHAGSGAIWDLNSNTLRPKGWTSADAAGLPIFPGLIRYDEVASGEIAHAIRFTIQRSQKAFLWPARHLASSVTDVNAPPMGLRLRLKASFNIANFSAKNQVILRALKKYGMFVADNGSNWYLSGAPDERWDNNELNQLKTIQGSNFEVVDETALMTNENSGQAGTAPTASPGFNIADVNQSGKVDIFDYNIILRDYGKTGTGLQGDVNKDNDCDIFDYNQVMANYGK